MWQLPEVRQNNRLIESESTDLDRLINSANVFKPTLDHVILLWYQISFHPS